MLRRLASFPTLSQNRPGALSSPSIIVEPCEHMMTFARSASVQGLRRAWTRQRKRTGVGPFAILIEEQRLLDLKARRARGRLNAARAILVPRVRLAHSPEPPLARTGGVRGGGDAPPSSFVPLQPVINSPDYVTLEHCNSSISERSGIQRGALGRHAPPAVPRRPHRLALGGRAASSSAQSARGSRVLGALRKPAAW